MQEIMELEIIKGTKYISKHQSEQRDTHMSDKISFFAAHGVDVSKIKGTDGSNIYSDWMREKRFEAIDQKMKKIEPEKRKKPVEIFDKDIQGFLLEKELKRNG